MTNTTNWLPPLILFEDYQGNWKKYLAALYIVYQNDFVNSRPKFQGDTLAVKRHPVVEGKEATFWHLIQEGDVEKDRIPNFRRCERIQWPRPIIEHADESDIKIWENRRQGETRICIWLENRDYLVILAKRNTYTLFWTAYPVTREHTKRKLQKEYDAFKKAGVA